MPIENILAVTEEKLYFVNQGIHIRWALDTR